jgi:hypothetical protein
MHLPAEEEKARPYGGREPLYVTSACVSIRQHASAYVSIRILKARPYGGREPLYVTSACVSIRQHTSAYVSIRQHIVD